MRRLLVTGGAGFIGSAFVRYWLDSHPDDRVVVLDALTYAGSELNLVPVQDRTGLSFVRGDIRDGELVARLFAEHGIDTVVHFAAESHVDRSIDGPDVFLDTNVMGTHELLKAARVAWDGRAADEVRFHHVSTDEVFGSLAPDEPAFTETTPYAPNSPYSASKAASDHIVRAYSRTFGLPATISNCSNNYGPFQFPEKLIPVIIFNALAGRPLPIYGDGSNVRDWLFVEDHCRGIRAVLDQGEVGGYYNIGGDCEVSNLELVRALCGILDQVRPRQDGRGYAEQIEFVSDRPGHDHRYAIDHAKLTTDAGWEPTVTLEQGLRMTVDWYLANQVWCQSVGADASSAERRGGAG